MSKNSKSKTATNGLTRRDFVKVAGLTAAASAAGLVTSRASAGEMARVDEKDPTAMALKYVHDASTADAAMRKEGSKCNNCALYAGTAKDEWAACSIFPGKAVAGAGWCQAWAAKPG